MNISTTWHTDITRLPRTSVELARIIKASQPTANQGHVARRITGDRFSFESSNPAVTYVTDGSRVTLTKNLTGALVDIRA